VITNHLLQQFLHKPTRYCTLSHAILSEHKALSGFSVYLDHRSGRRRTSFFPPPFPLAHFPERGGPVLAKNPCVRLDKEALPLFDLGLDGDVLRTKELVADVREDSEAFKAGVRDGQEVFDVSPLERCEQADAADGSGSQWSAKNRILPEGKVSVRSSVLRGQRGSDFNSRAMYVPL
jgi:hypothetical protein